MDCNITMSFCPHLCKPTRLKHLKNYSKVSYMDQLICRFDILDRVPLTFMLIINKKRPLLAF